MVVTRNSQCFVDAIAIETWNGKYKQMGVPLLFRRYPVNIPRIHV